MTDMAENRSIKVSVYKNKAIIGFNSVCIIQVVNWTTFITGVSYNLGRGSLVIS